MSTTMNAKLNLLDDMAQVLAAPKTKSNSTPRTDVTPAAVRLSHRLPVVRRAQATRSQSLWRVSLEAARDTVAERLLAWTLFACAATGLAWLAFMMLQFILAWGQLVTWVRSA
ncbi:MAG TPA: hypothetical protein DCE44_19995, partial [Verrucomicrobiales bacterium]|nr:hypothetical protein [Verrucomicrobiales bacterium]